MNENEMIEEMAKIANFSAFDYRQGTIQSKTIYTAMAEALYNANYRKIGEDEIVIKADIKCVDSTTAVNAIEFFAKHNAKVRQETTREIFEDILKRIDGLEYRANTQRKTVKVEELKSQCDWLIHKVVPKTIKDLAKEKGIELED